MKAKLILFMIVLLICVLLAGDGGNRFVLASNELKRVRFQITTVAENAGGGEKGRKILAQTIVEGLPGTDFNINLQTENYKMQTRFLSDLIAEDKLKLRAKLNTRRFYGYSPANLPLYEEDVQNQTLQIGFDETVVLLPFGRKGDAETLKIEITPILIFVSKADEDARKLKIDFDKQIPGGEIFIEASKTPHRFRAEVVLLADGQPIAQGTGDCLLEDATEIALLPIIANSNLDGRQFAAKLTINKFTRNRPMDLVGIDFGFYRATGEQSSAGNSARIFTGAGIGSLGETLTYSLKSESLPSDKNYELKFKIKIAENEQGD